MVFSTSRSSAPSASKPRGPRCASPTRRWPTTSPTAPAWPATLAGSEGASAAQADQWRREHAANICLLPEPIVPRALAAPTEQHLLPQGDSGRPWWPEQYELLDFFPDEEHLHEFGF